MRHQLRKILFIPALIASILTVLAVRNVFAQEPLRLNLSGALAMAQERHAQVIMADERVNQALARIEENRSSLLPQLTGSASQYRQTKDLRAVGTATAGSDPHIGPFNSFDARIKLTQTIFDKTALERLKTAQDSHALSLAEYRQIKQDVLALVAALYVDARYSAESAKLFKDLLRRDEKRLHLAHVRYQSGIAFELEVKRARADYARSLYLWRSAMADSIERRLDLAAALDIPNARPIIFLKDDDLLNFPSASEKKANEALPAQPEIEVAAKDLELRKSEHRSEKAGYLPKVQALADFGASGKNVDQASGTYALGLQVSMPIFEGGLRDAKVKEAQSKVEEKETNLENVKRQIVAKTLSAVEAVGQARFLLKEKDAKMLVAQKEFSLARHRLTTGIGSELEEADARAGLALVRDERNSAQAYYLMAQVNLAHALGQVDHLAKIEQREVIK